MKRKTRKAFSLIEVLIAILLLSLITLFLIPAVTSNLENSRKIKDIPYTSFILEKAIETSRNKQIGHRENKEINGKNVEISVEKYENQVLTANYKKIRASFEGQSFELIEACNEEGF